MQALRPCGPAGRCCLYVSAALRPCGPAALALALALALAPALAPALALGFKFLCGPVDPVRIPILGIVV